MNKYQRAELHTLKVMLEEEKIRTQRMKQNCLIELKKLLEVYIEQEKKEHGNKLPELPPCTL